jgi:thiamine biosynthesis lipoprotein
VRSGLASARVDLIDPWGAKPISVVLGSDGLATSSVTRRRWRVGDQEAHHLIDPRSGDPAISPVLSATASCATAAEAEAGAKAILLLGADGLAWADEQPWIRSAMAVWDGGSVFATTGWTVAA